MNMVSFTTLAGVACMCVWKKKRKMPEEVAGCSRLIEEFFRNVKCGRGSKHWGALREKWEGQRT